MVVRCSHSGARAKAVAAAGADTPIAESPRECDACRQVGRLCVDGAVVRLAFPAWSPQTCRRTRTSSFRSSTPCRRSGERLTPRRSRRGWSRTWVRRRGGRRRVPEPARRVGPARPDGVGALLRQARRSRRDAAARLYVLTAEGKRVLSLPDAEARQVVDEMDRQVRRARSRQKPKGADRADRVGQNSPRSEARPSNPPRPCQAASSVP